MGLTQAERQKQYRQRKRAKMGEAAYKKEQNLKRNNNRKGISNKIKPPTDAKCDDIMMKIYTKKRKTNNTLTIEQFKKNYWNPMMNLYKSIHNRQYDCGDISWMVDDPQSIIDFVKSKYSNLNTQKYYLFSLGQILKEDRNYKNIGDIYLNEAKKLKEEIEKINDKNLVKENERDKIIEWQHLKNIWKNENLDLRDRVLIGLYLTIPPRRVELTQYLKISINDKDLPEGFNYLIVSNTGKPIKIIMKKYKTYKHYGEVELPLNNNEYNKLLKSYLKKLNLQPMQYVFTTREGKMISGMSKLITEIFNKTTGKSIGVDILRHSFITQFLKKKRTTEEQKELARKMGHNIISQIEYNRINL